MSACPLCGSVASVFFMFMTRGDVPVHQNLLTTDAGLAQ